MSDQDLLQLYSTRILALAADIPRLGRLDAPDGTASRRAPLCGSSVSVGLCVRGGRIADFAQEVKACALGQAAASIVGRTVVGRSRDEMAAARDALWRMLRDVGEPPPAPFQDFAVLLAARGHPNRHGSIMLALEATLEAMDQAASKGKKAAVT